MPGSVVAGAWVDIHPELSDFAEELKSRLEEITNEERSSVDIEANLDDANAKASLEDLKADLADLSVDLSTTDAAAHLDALNAELDDLRVDLESMMNVDLDTADAQAHLDAIALEVEELSAMVEEPRELGLDTSDAQAKIAALQAQLALLQEEPGGGAAGPGLSSAARNLNTAQFGSADPVADLSRSSDEGAESLEKLQAEMRSTADEFSDLSTKTAMYSADAQIALGQTDLLMESLDGAGNAGRGAGAGLSDAEGATHGLLGAALALSPALASIGEVGIGGGFVALPGILTGLATGALAAVGPVESISGVLKDYSAANTDTGQTTQEAAQQMATLNAAMDKLSPSAQNAVGIIEGQLLPAWQSFVSSDATAFFDAAEQGMEDLLPLFQQIEPFILDAARGLGEFFTQMGNWSRSTEGVSTLNSLLREGSGFMSDIGKAAEDAIQGFLQMGAQAAPIVGGLGKDIEDVAAGFEKWSTDGGAQKFIAMIEREAPSVKNLLGEMVSTVTDVVKALSTAGPVLDPILTEVLRLADDLAKANPLLVSFGAIFAGLKLTGIASSLMGIGGEAGTATSEVGGLAKALGSLAGTVVTATVIMDIIESLTSGLPNASDNVPGAQAVRDKIPVLGGTAANIDDYLLHGDQQQYYATNPSQDQSTGGNANASQSGTGITSAAQARIESEMLNGSISYAEGAKQLKALAAEEAKKKSDPTTLPKPYAAGGGTPSASSAASTAQSLTNSVNSMLQTLSSLAAPARNAVASQQASISGNRPAYEDLIKQIVAAHSSALDKLLPELEASWKAVGEQLVQLQRAQNVTDATNRINATTALDSTNAQGLVSQLTDAAAVALDKANITSGGSTPVTSAQLNVDQTQQSTDAAVTAAQDQVDAANAEVAAAQNGTALQQAEAQKRLAIANQGLTDAQNSQSRQMQAANAQLSAAQTQAAAASAELAAIDQMASDVSNGITQMISDVTSAVSDAISANTDVISATSSLQADISKNAVQATNDATQLAVDTLAEQGLSGLALQAADAKVALDQMTQSYDAQIGAQQVSNDNANASQTALVDQAKASLDSVTSSTQDAVNKAQTAFDAYTEANANDTSSATYSALAQQLQLAKDSQQQQVAAANATYSAAQATAAQVAATGNAAITSITDSAQQNEAQSSQLYQLLEAKANGSGGLTNYVNITGINNPLAAVDAMIFELRAAGAFS